MAHADESPTGNQTLGTELNTHVVSAFMKLTSTLREADGAEKRMKCPDGGGVSTTKQGKGRVPGPVLPRIEVKEGREEGNIRPGA